jgi:hypothetical protein
MTAPVLPSSFALTATSDYASIIELSHPAVVATPAVLGYKYFVDTSLSGVLAKAAADIAADTAARANYPPPQGAVPTGFGGIVSNPLVLTDVGSSRANFGGPTYTQTPLAVQVSRLGIAGTVSFPYAAGTPGAAVTYYFAVVVWNEDGPSVVTTTSLVYGVPSAPVLRGASSSATELTATFDQPVTSSVGRFGDGFTFTVDGVAAVASAAVQVPGVPASILFTMASPLHDRDTVRISYDATKGDLTNIPGTNPVQTFLNAAVYNQSAAAALAAVVVALAATGSNLLTALFSLPVTSSNYLNGLSFTANGVPVTPSGAAPGADPRELVVTFPNMFDATDAITMAYDSTAGDWQSSGYLLPSIPSIPVTNASRIGTAYPLSSVIQEPLCARAGGIVATVGVDLNYVDRELVRRYGPISVDFGGTFGITPQNPAGVFIPQDLQILDTGLQVSKTFMVPGIPAYATDAGKDWLQVVTERIGVALGTLRTMDASVVLGELHVSQV